jgi:hypothetical protein
MKERASQQLREEEAEKWNSSWSKQQLIETKSEIKNKAGAASSRAQTQQRAIAGVARLLE